MEVVEASLTSMEAVIKVGRSLSKLPQFSVEFYGYPWSINWRGTCVRLRPTSVRHVTGLFASYMVDCESCLLLISIIMASTQSTELELTSGHHFDAGDGDMHTVC